MATNKYDLTQGKILNKLLLVALPIMGTSLFTMIHSLIDMFLLGRISSDVVAAAGVASMFVWLSGFLNTIGQSGAAIGVSQSFGKKQYNQAKSYSTNASFLALILGLFMGLSYFFLSDLLIGFFNIQDPSVYIMASQYLSIMGLGLPFEFVLSSISSTFNGSGNSRLPFIVRSIGILINIILNIVLIFYLEMGIQGAAIATIIAHISTCLLMLGLIKYHKNRPFETYSYLDIFRINIASIKQIFKWTLPISAETFIYPALTIIVQRNIASFGTNPLAVYSIGAQIESLTWTVGNAFASAVTIYVGQNYGAKLFQRILDGIKVSLKLMFFYGLLVSLLLFFGARFFYEFFVTNIDVIQLGQTYLRIFALIQIFICIEYVCSATFRGLGKTLVPSTIAIIGNVLRVVLSYLLSLTFLGINGIWIGLALGSLSISITMITLYYVKIYRNRIDYISQLSQ